MKPKSQTKLVRIDSKTLIEVDQSIPDEIAVEEYLLKTGAYKLKQKKNDVLNFARTFGNLYR